MNIFKKIALFFQNLWATLVNDVKLKLIVYLEKQREPLITFLENNISILNEEQLAQQIWILLESNLKKLSFYNAISFLFVAVKTQYNDELIAFLKKAKEIPVEKIVDNLINSIKEKINNL